MRQQVSILQGDALEQLRTLPDESVQCVVTSPPYFGLRDYGTAEWDGGADDCSHVSGKARQDGTNGRANSSTFHGSMSTDHGGGATQFRNECGKCGATRIDRQIGLESTPAEYVDKMVAVFREVRRVLRKDGVAWVNMGDSYGATGGDTHSGFNERYNGTGGAGSRQDAMLNGVKDRTASTGLRPKNLLGMPWRLAFALQADGWYLRQDIIWAKPNPMPESVTDRCTKAHEYVFLLSKSERYFYDAAAIAEPAIYAGETGYMAGPKNASRAAVSGNAPTGNEAAGAGRVAVGDTRNKRSVWTLTTESYPEAHFATFPTELPRICILAGSRVGDVILDPFNGSGTTGQVAIELARQYVGIELNEAYVALTNKRLSRTTLGLPLEIAA